MNYPTLYEHKPPSGMTELQYFETFGMGVLTECISCIVREERNGTYELEMEYKSGTRLSYELKVGRYIMSDVTSEEKHIRDAAKRQPFKIYSITRTLKGNIRVNAEHATFGLNGYPIFRVAAKPKVEGDKVTPRTVSPRDYLKELTDKTFAPNENSTLSKYSISIDSSLGTTPKPLTFDIEKRSLTSALLEGEQSFLGLYGGEIVRDKHSIKIFKEISTQKADDWYRIEYGYNMNGFDLKYDFGNVATHVIPYVTLNVPTNLNQKKQEQVFDEVWKDTYDDKNNKYGRVKVLEPRKDKDGNNVYQESFYYIDREDWKDESLEIYPQNEAINIPMRDDAGRKTTAAAYYGFQNAIFVDMAQHAEYLRAIWIGRGAEAIAGDVPISFEKRRNKVNASMDSLVKDWVNFNKPHLMDLTCTVDFLSIWDAEEYRNIKGLERLRLGDYATIYHPDIPFPVDTKCIATEFDVLKNRFTKIDLASRFEGLDDKIRIPF